MKRSKKTFVPDTSLIDGEPVSELNYRREKYA